MTDAIQLIINALLFILPAYFANGAPVVFGGGPPIDCGRKFPDGRRIFGQGKSIRGFVAGVIAGVFIGALQGRWAAGLLLALGALLGDLLGSFLKRRMGIERGGAALGLDQLGFVVIAVLFVLPVEVPTLEIFLVLLMITPLIHLATNFVGYKLGFKDRPY